MEESSNHGAGGGDNVMQDWVTAVAIRCVLHA